MSPLKSRMIYRSADCVLDTRRLTLERGGSVVPVEPKVFDLLVILIENAGCVVSKDALVAEIWDGRAVSDSAISARIAGARKAVGDDGKSQRVIRTVARRGLEWTAAVSVDQDGEGEADASAQPRPDETLKIRYARNRNGRAIAYAITGSGPPMVLVRPPMMTDLQQLWQHSASRALVDALGAHHQVLSYDHVGCGQSDRVTDSFDFWDFAGDLGCLMDAAGWSNVMLMSISGGAHTALRFAARHPDRVSRLVVVGGYETGRALRRNSPDPIRGLFEEAHNSDQTGLAEAMMLAYWPEGPIEPLREKARIVKTVASPENAVRMRDEVNMVRNTDILGRVRCPTLVIHGRDDGVHPLSEAQGLAAGIPNAELVVLDTANHWPLPGNAVWQEYLSTVLEFLGLGPEID